LHTTNHSISLITDLIDHRPIRLHKLTRNLVNPLERQIRMKITRYSSLCLVALSASISLGAALADSTDEALNQFYVDNMAARLTSEAPAITSENSPGTVIPATTCLIRSPAL